MIPKEMKSAALALTLGMLAAVAATPAGATGYVCAVLPTSDGFVALRDGPSAKHAMIARMRAHELLDTMDEKTQDRVISGNWIRVTWYSGTRRTAFHIPETGHRVGRVGWMHGNLLNCFE